MDSPHDRIIFFTKLLAALVMILNIGLVLSLRLHMRLVKELRAAGGQATLRSKLVLVLALIVIFVNGLVVYANHEMLKAAKEIAPVVKS